VPLVLIAYLVSDIEEEISLGVEDTLETARAHARIVHAMPGSWGELRVMKW